MYAIRSYYVTAKILTISPGFKNFPWRMNALPEVLGMIGPEVDCPMAALQTKRVSKNSRVFMNRNNFV